MAASETAVRKKIFFFRSIMVSGDKKRVKDFQFQDNVREFREVLAADRYRGYSKETDGREHYLWVRDDFDEFGATFVPCRLGSIRRLDLPEQEFRGIIEPIEMMNPEAGIVDSTFILICPGNVVGMIFHGFSPKHRRLSKYVTEKTCVLDNDIRIEPIIRHETLNEIKEYRNIVELEYKVRVPRKVFQKEREALETMRGLAAAVPVYSMRDGADFVTIKIEVAKKKKESLMGSVVETIKDIFHSQSQEDGFVLEGCKISGHKGDESSLTPLDLMNDRFVQSEKINLKTNEKSRALDEYSAYYAIAKNWNEYRHTIESGVIFSQND